MKRRNAETGKMRRPMKRTKITEGMYGNSMLYLKFVMVWATVVMADYMLEFRFEFLWPFWMMLRSVYDTYKYQGLAFSVFFICIALTSDVICFFFIPVQYTVFAASTYVWVQYVWYTFAERGLCVPTAALCCAAACAWGAWRGARGALVARLAAHCVGYPAARLGLSARALLARRLRLRRQRHVRAVNDFYEQLMRDALPPSALDQAQPSSDAEQECADVRPANGSLRRRLKPDHNGHCVQDHTLPSKLERVVDSKQPPLTNGTACHAHPDDEHTRGSTKSSKLEKKEASTLREDKKKSKHKVIDKESNDSHKSTEHTRDQIVKDKDLESTKECVKLKECSNSHKEKEKERDREREIKEKEKEREREREREREQREEELRRARAEAAAARAAEAKARAAEEVARSALAAATSAERARRAEHQQLKHAHAALQQRVAAWRNGERAALERRLGEERRAREHAELLLRARHAPPTGGECENETCKSRRAASETETAALRRDLQHACDRYLQLQRDFNSATEQAGAAAGWRARGTQLERALSAETRVKLDLLAALGDARRRLQLRDDIISRQEKEIEELKAQMLAVMPSELVPPLEAGALCSDA